MDSVGAGGVSRLAGPWSNLDFTQSSVKPAVPNHIKEMLLVKHGRYPRIMALLVVMLLLAVAGCAGPRAGAVSHVSSPATTSAFPTTLPPAVPKTAVPSKRLPSATPPLSPRLSCGSGRAAGTVVLDLPGGRRALLAVPSGDDGHHRLGLVIALPGYGRTSE